MQVPLLNQIERHDGPRGLRVPQSGWLHEPGPGSPDPGSSRPRQEHLSSDTPDDPVHRDEADASEADSREDRMAHVLFDDSEAIGLYGKPMARNSQIWTEDFRLLLDGPNAGRAQIEEAAGALKRGGLFGYRFQFPAMRVGRHELYWHRPLAAFLAETSDRVTVLLDGPTGYLTATTRTGPGPRRRSSCGLGCWIGEPHKAAGSLFDRVRDPHDPRDRGELPQAPRRPGAPGRPAVAPVVRPAAAQGPQPSDARGMAGWPARSCGQSRAGATTRGAALRAGIETGSSPPAPGESLTFARTARRTFEVAYWKTIARLTDGRFANRNNADCALDAVTSACPHRPRPPRPRVAGRPSPGPSRPADRRGGHGREGRSRASSRSAGGPISTSAGPAVG